ncbi:hypothetical protein [Halorussus lipolyticus]|nr:hypothetical protein [Halorussus sp. DT80]
MSFDIEDQTEGNDESTEPVAPGTSLSCGNWGCYEEPNSLSFLPF